MKNLRKIILILKKILLMQSEKELADKFREGVNPEI